MIKPETGNAISDLSFVNQCLMAGMVIFAAIILLDSVFYKKSFSRLNVDIDRLEKSREQVLLLENLYHTLKEKQASVNNSLVFFDPKEQVRMKIMSQKDIVIYLAEKNGMRVSWIDTVQDVYSKDLYKDQQMAVYLKGDFKGLKDFLLDVMSWPRLRQMPLLQVFAGKEELDILVKIKVEPKQTEPLGETVP